MPDDVKLSNNVNMFKHKVKKELFDTIKRKRSRYISMYTIGKLPSSSTLFNHGTKYEQEYSLFYIPIFLILLFFLSLNSKL